MEEEEARKESWNNVNGKTKNRRIMKCTSKDFYTDLDS